MRSAEARAEAADASGPPPDPPGSLLLIGHSHARAVGEAALAHGVLTLQVLNFWALPGAVERRAGKVRLAPAIVRRLDGHHGKVFSMIGGSVHNVLGMLVHPRRFDFILPAAPDLPLDAAAEVLPARAVEEAMRVRMHEFLALMDEVRAHSPAGMVHVESPPPSANRERLLRDVPWDMYPPNLLHEIAPLALRCKLWRLESQLLHEWCAAHAASFLACPRTCLDAQGCLADACYGDGAHANATYGWQVLQQMREVA